MKIIANLHDSIVKIDYRVKKPSSYVILVPIAAQIVQFVQLRELRQQYPNRNRDSITSMEYAKKADPIGYAHCLGAFIRLGLWSSLAYYYQSRKLGACALLAGAHLIHTSTLFKHTVTS